MINLSQNPPSGGLDLSMATLTQTIVGVKKLALFTAILAVGLISALVIFNLSKSIYAKIFPPKPIGVSSFGQLPSLELEKNPKVTLSSGYLFEIETQNYKLPDLGQYAKVFPIVEPTINLWSLENAKGKAKSLGFSADPEKLDEFNFRWAGGVEVSRTLTFNLKENAYSLRSNFISNSKITTEKKVMEDAAAIQKTRKFLSALGLDKKELTKTSLERLAIKDGKTVEAISKGETDLVRVNFQRGDIEKVPVISLNPKTFEISVLVTSLEGDIQKETVEADVSFWDLNLKGSSLYPLKTSTAAFEELKSGIGKIVSNKNKPGEKIKITNIYLAYFNPPKLEKYLQPIIVFDGENDFRAIVEAV